MAEILIVDDEIGVRELLTEVLQDEGHSVILAANGAEAREQTKRSSIEVILLDKDKSVMNRDKLLSVSQDLINKKKDGYKPPKQPTFKLTGGQVRDKMFQTLETLYKEKKILEHGMQVGKKLAFVLSGGNTTINKELSEDDMYALELETFVQLIQMEKTQARIKHTLSTGKPLVN